MERKTEAKGLGKEFNELLYVRKVGGSHFSS
jgi:hypothetical protein